jgi:TonB family protein
MRATTAALILGMISIMFAASAHSQDQNPPSDSKASASAPKPKSGEVEDAKLIHRVPPVYPPDAKKDGVSGTVVLHGVIAKDGSVQKLQYVSGPQPLTQSAMDAVAQWRYTPTTLNGQPVDVETNISVVYKLDPPPSNPAQENAAIDPQYKADVGHLLDVTHYREATIKAAKEGFESSRSRLSASFPDTPNRDKIVDAFAGKMVELIQSQEMTDRIVAVYHKYLSDDDVKTLTQFYASPVGQHFSAAEVEMVSDLSQAGNQVAREGIPGIFKGLCNDYPELQGKAKFCPATPADAPEAPPTLNAPAPPTQPTPATAPAPPTKPQ